MHAKVQYDAQSPTDACIPLVTISSYLRMKYILSKDIFSSGYHVVRA